MLAIETAKKAGFPVVGVYDPHTFGQEGARTLSDIYVEQGGSFTELIAKIENRKSTREPKFTGAFSVGNVDLSFTDHLLQARGIR